MTTSSSLSAAQLPAAMAVRLPQGQTIGPANAPVRLELSGWSALAWLKAGQIGALAEEFVEGRLKLEGAMRDVMAAVVQLMPNSPVNQATGWSQRLLHHARSLAAHTPGRDAEQIQFHYDVSDDFYALWLDPRRVYSCAYYADPAMDLTGAQEAKLDHICRKLMLRPGERFLDIGAGWGGLLLWAAEHYGVHATGITLSRNQHAHVQQMIDRKGLAGRVQMHLRDYRHLDEAQPFDKIASIGMFEHVGHAQMQSYFRKIWQLLAPGGLLLNHGITAGTTAHRQLGAGMGEFIEKYIFPGGELMHVSTALAHLAEAGLEMVDTENMRPHYARTLWDWSDALELRLDKARQVLAADGGPARAEKTLRAYRLYLAGSAMSFEQGWIALHQVLAMRPSGKTDDGSLRGSQSPYPFNRSYMYASPGGPSRAGGAAHARS